MADVIERRTEIAAPVARVWRALTDHREFGQWFRVDLDGPFVVGEESRGRMTYPGHEGHPWLAVVRAMEPERLFAFTWPHEGLEGTGGFSGETLVEFRLTPIPGGTLLVVRESGFENLPPDRRLEILRGNAEGWEIQSRNIAAHVTAHP